MYYLNPTMLKTFISCYESLNFTETAKSLGMTQPGVSQHIQNIEEILEKKLFERVGKKLFKTEFSHELYSFALKQIEEIEDFMFRVKTFDKDFKKRVSIGASGEFGQYYLNKFIEKRKDYKRYTLNMNFAPEKSLITMVERGEVDFAFFNHVPDIKNLTSEKIYDQEIALVMSKKDKRSINSLEDLLELDFIDHPNALHFLKIFTEHHYKKFEVSLDKINFSHHVNNLKGIVDLVIADLGCAIIPIDFLKNTAELKKLRINRDVGKEICSIPLYLSYKKQRKGNESYKFTKDILS